MRTGAAYNSFKMGIDNSSICPKLLLGSQGGGYGAT
jgi:hypothetical protein